MSNYFRRLPNLDYPSLLNDRESNIDFVQTKNLFRRAKVREDLFANFMQFDKYQIIGDERPDNVAEKVYDRDDYDNKAFRTMYGADASFINATNMMQVARTMNKKFLQK